MGFTTEQRTRLGRCFVALLCFLNIYINPQWINVIQFWASIVPIISMIKWQSIVVIIIIVTKLLFLLLLSLFLLSLLFSWCAVLTNTPGLRDPVVMRVLSDFYQTAATGAWFVYVKQRTASCWPLRGGGTCTLLRTSFVDMNTGRHWVLIVDQSDHGNIPDAVTWACVVRMKTRFVLLICKLSPGVVTL